MSITDNLKEVRKYLSDAKLVAVTKTVDIEVIRELIRLGCTDFGENRINVAEAKISALGHEGIRWHMIGHLQSNKAKRAVNLFDVIHSVDSLKLLSLLDKEAEKIGKRIDVLIQINIGEEPQKNGISPDSVEEFFREASAIGLKNVRIIGLMGMAPFASPEDARLYFRKMKEIYDALSPRYGITEISMGMTNDYRIAVEEGSTMVRVGTALFE